MEMLEPPPDMPQVFKDCIQDLGGSEINLVIQKSLFLNEDEERMLNAKRQMAMTLVEPCLSV
ncbi:hypothetical protein J1N35_042666 [Gossypium stocksii]|uniref:Uncharacterized protein n=1 Tax=Gossypium stocksii TaxID=47602 RepID=A0A9D3U5Z2_9ROSI|nr:hypothetical protein J1N35_042666 [Gossypium stocksii]